jgi:hypothetical protein
VDSFATRNQFYGGQLGAVVEVRRGPWIVDLTGKIALGATHEVINIDGNQLVVPNAGPRSTSSGGLLALPNANIGHHARNEFAFVPEGGINLAYQLSDHVRARVGYTFLYWSNVVRPGDQIDVRLAENKIPNFVLLQPAALRAAPVTVPNPVVPFKSSDFWAQGLNVGLEIIW